MTLEEELLSSISIRFLSFLFHYIQAYKFFFDSIKFYKKRLLLTRILYPLITLIGLIILGEFSLFFLNNYAKEKENSTLNTASFVIAQNIQQQITMGISSIYTLESMLRLDDFKMNNFEKWAKEIMKNTPYIETIQLAPDGIVSYIYPMNDHKKAIGHNILSDPKRKNGALKALESNDILFVGPLKLIQNNKLAIIARKPISKLENNKTIFWGFATTIIYIDDLVKTAFKGLDKSKLAFKLYGSNPDFPNSNIILESKKPLATYASSYPINVPNAQWHLVIDYIHTDSCKKYIFHVIVFFFALFMSLIIFYFEKRSFIQTVQLKKLNHSLGKMVNTDILTRLSNRRSGLEFIQRQLKLCKREKKDFSLCFFDIDFFKKINDTYGHEIGDLALQHFAKLAEKNIRKSDMFARWGGEEFLLVLPMTNAKGSYTICENLRKLIHDTPLVLNNQTITMTVSIGITSLQDSTENIDNLLQRVDKALYEAKDNGRNQTVVI